MTNLSANGQNDSPSATRLQVTRRLSFSSVPDIVFRLTHLRFESRLTLAWALGRPADWSFSVGHLCHELGLTDYRWRVVRRELMDDGWLIQSRANERIRIDAHGRITEGGFRWTLTFTDAPLVEAMTAPDSPEQASPASRPLNTTDPMPDAASEPAPSTRFPSPGVGSDCSSSASDAAQESSDSSAKGSSHSTNFAYHDAMDAKTTQQSPNEVPIRRDSTDGVSSPSVDPRRMENSTHGTPYISNQDDDDDVEPPKPPAGFGLFDNNPEAGQEATTQAPDTDTAKPIAVGAITDRIVAEGFRMPQVIGNRMLARIRHWQALKITADELDRAMAMAHANLGEGKRPGSPHYYDWAVKKIIAEREAENAPVASTDAQPETAPQPTGATTRNQRKRFSNHDRQHARTVRPAAAAGYSPHPEDYRVERTEAVKAREREQFGFCREDLEPGARDAQGSGG